MYAERQAAVAQHELETAQSPGHFRRRSREGGAGRGVGPRFRPGERGRCSPVVYCAPPVPTTKATVSPALRPRS
jgi:hypothetical protein